MPPANTTCLSPRHQQKPAINPQSNNTNLQLPSSSPLPHLLHFNNAKLQNYPQPSIQQTPTYQTSISETTIANQIQAKLQAMQIAKTSAESRANLLNDQLAAISKQHVNHLEQKDSQIQQENIIFQSNLTKLEN